MHSQLLHEALQKEETRAIVIKVEDGPEEPGEDEEFYAADFELLGQEDEDEDEEVISEYEAPPLVSSDGEHDGAVAVRTPRRRQASPVPAASPAGG
jgi:hypothetical protein